MSKQRRKTHPPDESANYLILRDLLLKQIIQESIRSRINYNLSPEVEEHFIEMRARYMIETGNNSLQFYKEDRAGENLDIILSTFVSGFNNDLLPGLKARGFQLAAG